MLLCFNEKLRHRVNFVRIIANNKQQTSTRVWFDCSEWILYCQSLVISRIEYSNEVILGDLVVGFIGFTSKAL